MTPPDSLTLLPEPDTSPSADAPKRPRGRPRKTVDERDDGNRRHELLSAAAQLFRRKGFAATTTRDIAAAAGMQSGSPFYHFKSKDALLFAVMEQGMHTALARQQAIPFLPVVEFEAWPLHKDLRSPQDTGACSPAVKAAIDGIVCALDGIPWDHAQRPS